MKRTLLPIAFILLFALSLSACGTAASTTVPETAATLPAVIDSSGITAEGRLEPVHFVHLALNTNGLVSEVLDQEGSQVQAGQVIARLENDQAQTLEAARASVLQQLTTAHEAVRDAQYRLDNFDVPSEFNDMAPQQAIAAMLDKLNAARAAYEPYKNLGRDNADRKEYRKRLDDAWSDYRKAIQWLDLTSALESMQVQLDLVQKDYSSLQDNIEGADASGVRAALANAELRAPFQSTLTELKLKVGEFASAGQPVATVADLSQWVVKTTDLTELDVVNVTEGQPVEIRLDAIPGKVFQGNVLSISQGFSENQGDIVYEVAIALQGDDPALRWGMTAELSFK